MGEPEHFDHGEGKLFFWLLLQSLLILLGNGLYKLKIGFFFKAIGNKIPSLVVAQNCVPVP